MKTPAKLTNDVIKIICNHYEVTVTQALSPCRSRSCFLARRDIAIFLRGLGWSYPMIGRKINRDHTTVLNCVGRLTRRGKWKQPDPIAIAIQSQPRWARGRELTGIVNDTVAAYTRKPIGFREAA